MGYNNQGEMDWLIEENNLGFYTYVNKNDLKLIKTSVRSIFIPRIKDINCIAGYAENKNKIPASFYFSQNDTSLFQKFVLNNEIINQDQYFKKHLIDDVWKLFMNNFKKVQIIDVINLSSLNSEDFQITKFKTKKI